MTVAPATPARLVRLVLVLLGLVVVVGLVGHGAPASASTSSEQTSTAKAEPQLSWAQDTVYVESDATSRWPVKTATERLSAVSALKLVLVTKCPVRTSAAQAPVQCIKVSSGDLGGGTLAGTTHWTYNKSTDKLSTVTTTLNDRWAAHASYKDRLNIAEHELGHGVGLEHVSRTSSVMNGVAHGRTKPDAGDVSELKKLYR